MVQTPVPKPQLHPSQNCLSSSCFMWTHVTRPEDASDALPDSDYTLQRLATPSPLCIESVVVPNGCEAPPQHASAVKPPAVCCHSFVATEDNKRLISFGGAVIGQEFGDVYSYFIEENRWVQEEAANSHLASPRMSHTAVMIGEEMIVYGGLSSNNGHYSILEDTIALNVNTMSWRRYCANHPCPETGNAFGPGPRRSHSAVAYKGKMYVYMGFPYTSPKEVFEFDPATGLWRAISDDSNFQKPVFSLHGHSAVCDETHMYVFGGQANVNPQMFNNRLYRFSFQTHKWAEVAVESSPMPAPRYAQCMGMLNGTIVVQGGDSHQCTVYYDDTWVIDVRDIASTSATSAPAPLRWREVTDVTGPMRPTKRSGHCSAIANGCLYVFGGECPSGDQQFVLYSAEVYRLPLGLTIQSPLIDLVTRWLSIALSPECENHQLQALLDRDNRLLARIPAAVRRRLQRYLVRGTPERPSERHRLPGY
jgi:N-acetylneuraminic acid mutarotase